MLNQSQLMNLPQMVNYGLPQQPMPAAHFQQESLAAHPLPTQSFGNKSYADGATGISMFGPGNENLPSGNRTVLVESAPNQSRAGPRLSKKEAFDKRKMHHAS